MRVSREFEVWYLVTAFRRVFAEDAMLAAEGYLYAARTRAERGVLTDVVRTLGPG